MPGTQDHNLTLRALIILLLIAFAFYLGTEFGLVQNVFLGDKSYISFAIGGVYAGATLHWLWLAHSLARERRQIATLEDEGTDLDEPLDLPRSHVARLLGDLSKKSNRDSSILVAALGDDLANRHALGHFLSDVLLKLGLMGTVVGFILMLLPVGQAGAFDPKLMQQLLASMSSGMSVALYTTLAGLVTSTLLKAQYYLLDASLAEFVNRLIVFVDVHLDSDAS